MSHNVQMPALGESVTEGTVTRWLKQVGDQVAVDEPLLEVSTDKVDTEIPSPVAGVLEQIAVAEDDVVEVGGLLAVIGDGSGAAAPTAAPAAPAAAEPAAPAEAPAPAAAPAESAPAPAPAGPVSGTDIVLPAMGESVTEGTVTRWLKQVGDQVAVDEPLVEISTDKVDTEVPSPVAGTLLEISVGEDETVEVGGKLAVIGDASAAPAAAPEPAPAPEPAAPEPAPAAAEPPAPAAPAPAATAPAAPAAATPAPAAPSAPAWQPKAPEPAGLYVTPVIRKLAADSGVDLASVTGTGVGGRIRREDVVAAAEALKAAQAAPAAPAPAPAAAPAPAKAAAPVSELIGTTQKLPRIRQSIAKNMVYGLQTAAQLTTVQEADLTRVAQLRTRAKKEFAAREGVNLSFLPFYVKAAIEALRAFPIVNSTVTEDLKEITYHASVHLGVAVDTPRGLIVPVIKDAQDLNIAGLARKIADLAQRTRDNKIGPDELSGATFTVTNIGSVGALFDTPIFVPPQSAIFGTGAIVKRPVVVTDADGNESIGIRSMSHLVLSYDHRTIDGADASRWVTAVRNRLEAGEFEGDLGL